MGIKLKPAVLINLRIFKFVAQTPRFGKQNNKLS